MKKKITMFIVIVVIGLGIFFSTSGAMTSVVLTDYSVSEDKSVLTINVAVMSSVV